MPRRPSYLHPAASDLAARYPAGWVEPAVLAADLGVNYTTVLKWVRSGALRAFDVGGRGRGPYRVHLGQLDAFLVARETMPTMPDPEPEASIAQKAPKTAQNARRRSRTAKPSSKLVSA